MKFKISKSKPSVPNKQANVAEKNKTNSFLNINQEIKDAERESKSANMLFSLKSKTKMKRSHQKMNGIVISTVIASQNEKNSVDQNNLGVNFKNEKNLKKINFKQFGTTFANLFRPNKSNTITCNEKIKIDNENIFFPVPIRFDSKKKDSPILRVGEYRTSSIEIGDKAATFKSVSSLIQNFEEKANQNRKNQPSMGLKAYNIKTRISTKTEEPNAEIELEAANQKIFKNKSVIFNKLPKFETQNELNVFKSDSNLKRDLENQELYDCLINYESNELYQNAVKEFKSVSDDIKLNLDSDSVAVESQSDNNNLTPFLDDTRESYNPQPLLSSTAAEFDKDLSEIKLPITPLRLVSNMSKLKKLRSFSKMNIDN